VVRAWLARCICCVRTGKTETKSGEIDGWRGSKRGDERSDWRKSLWTAALVKAVEDWRFGTLRCRREAQEFLFENDNDFHTVCANAGLGPVSLRAKLLTIGKKLDPYVRFFIRWLLRANGRQGKVLGMIEIYGDDRNRESY
jgi:hypothetical protein